jgi:hypothetical protein
VDGMQILSHSFGLIFGCWCVHHLWAYKLKTFLCCVMLAIIALNVCSSVLISESLEQCQLLFLVAQLSKHVRLHEYDEW